MTGLEEPDSGRVSRTRGLPIGYLHQGDDLDDTHTVREAVLGGRADHEWAADPRTREVVEELLAGVALDRAVVGLSGGERRRCSLAALLLGDHDLIVLDEPTNHLDVEAVAWLAAPPRRAARRRWWWSPTTAGSSTRSASATWEVHDGVGRRLRGRVRRVRAGQGRARSGRPRPPRRAGRTWSARSWPGCAAAPPARTSKPKFRIDAANALIEDVPPPRDRLELQRFATQRLGKDVIDVEDVDLVARRPAAAARTPPGGSARATGSASSASTAPARPRCCRCSPARSRPTAGRVQARPDRRAAAPHPGARRPRPRGAGAADASSRSGGSPGPPTGEITATSLLERFGFTGDRLTARLGDLSGGERRRFQLLRLLLTEPNVLLLDEPTNDLDIETLNVLEDFLDGWPGTLVVVSHDRYFLERVTDSVWALLGDGQISMLPRGVDEYLERRAAAADLGRSRRVADRSDRADAGGRRARRRRQRRQRRRSGPPARPLARLDKQLERIAAREAELNAEIAAHAQDYERLAEPQRRSCSVLARRGGRARAGVARGRRAARVAARELGQRGTRNGRQSAWRRRRGAAQGRRSAARAGRRAAARSASSSASKAPSTARLALGGEPHQHAAPVVAGREPLDEAAGGEPVDPVGHRAAGHQGLAEQPAGGELVRRAGPPQRGQHVELPRLDARGR